MTPKDATDEATRIQASRLLGELHDTEDASYHDIDLLEYGITRGQAIERARVCEELRQRIDDQIAELQVKVEAAEMGGNNTPSEYSTIGTLSQVKGWLNEIEAA